VKICFTVLYLVVVKDQTAF